jgi:hypothetical protein
MVADLGANNNQPPVGFGNRKWAMLTHIQRLTFRFSSSLVCIPAERS